MGILLKILILAHFLGERKLQWAKHLCFSEANQILKISDFVKASHCKKCLKKSSKKSFSSNVDVINPQIFSIGTKLENLFYLMLTQLKHRAVETGKF